MATHFLITKKSTEKPVLSHSFAKVALLNGFKDVTFVEQIVDYLFVIKFGLFTSFSEKFSVKFLSNFADLVMVLRDNSTRCFDCSDNGFRVLVLGQFLNLSIGRLQVIPVAEVFDFLNYCTSLSHFLINCVFEVRAISVAEPLRHWLPEEFEFSSKWYKLVDFIPQRFLQGILFH